MKNRILPLLFVLGSFSAYSQVIVGNKEIQHTSAQLQVFAKDKGILIPNVALTSLTDAATISDGNVDSLMVFNIATTADLKPGYYYWYVDRWWRFALSGEANGIAGGNGEPGKKGEPGYPGENVSIYTDNETGIVYVQNPDGTWTAINGKNGIDGNNGIAGGAGLPGDAGLDGTIQMYIDYTTGIVYVRDPKDPNKWVPINGKDGNNGIAGGNGAPGAPGTAAIDGTVNIYVDNTTGIVYIRDPKNPDNWIPLNGKEGNNGKDGIAGGSGDPGAPGTAGIDGTIQIYVNRDTKVVFVRDPEDETKWIRLTGLDGAKGDTGAINVGHINIAD
ncbi:hypothetical protein [Flavobacterium sp. ACN6]|uniref:hypothetical protein n=1 Tax=Flavobacterium sp. ACN6 TaxID=1920426 RepID=UPI000BB3A17D|nr:hypothetical protein [Flavobacterium sp. ACN6]PBJ04384.1 Collagen triple helix repeat (20 copies) [Flavobacterium sp. ACN6]